jgi:transposase
VHLIGHWALGIGHWEEGPRRAYLTTRSNRYSYREIEKRLEFSTIFIAQTHKKYLTGGVAALKLKSPGLKSYLTKEQLSATIYWLSQPYNRNISELKRYLISNYQ